MFSTKAQNPEPGATRVDDPVHPLVELRAPPDDPVDDEDLARLLDGSRDHECVKARTLIRQDRAD